jgi:hypothetical protein
MGRFGLSWVRREYNCRRTHKPRVHIGCQIHWGQGIFWWGQCISCQWCSDNRYTRAMCMWCSLPEAPRHLRPLHKWLVVGCWMLDVGVERVGWCVDRMLACTWSRCHWCMGMDCGGYLQTVEEVRTGKVVKSGVYGITPCG